MKMKSNQNHPLVCERYKSLYNYVNDTVLITDKKGTILEANDKALYLLGSEIIGSNIDNWIQGFDNSIDSIMT